MAISLCFKIFYHFFCLSRYSALSWISVTEWLQAFTWAQVQHKEVFSVPGVLLTIALSYVPQPRLSVVTSCIAFTHLLSLHPSSMIVTI